MYYIYALKENDNIVYVGRTVNLKRRISEHKKTKKFDGYVVLEETECKDTSKRLEDFFITMNDPKYNKSLNSGGHYVSLTDLTKGKNYDIPKLLNLVNDYNVKPIFKDKYQDMTILTILKYCEVK